MPLPIRASLPFVLAALCSNPLAGAIRLPALFSDHALLQSEKPVPVWGWADPKEHVHVIFVDDSGATRAAAETTTLPDGQWSLQLPALSLGLHGTLQFTSDRAPSRLVEDVLVGEVWLASGQSNMSYPINAANAPASVLATAREQAQAEFGAIRYFAVTSPGAPLPQPDVRGQWVVVGPDQVGPCSAVAWDFAVALRRSIRRPIGLIVAAVGGTPAEAWISRRALESTSVGPAIEQRNSDTLAVTPLDAPARYQEALAAWKQTYPTPESQVGHRAPAEPYSETFRMVPCRLYNGKIHGLEPFGLKGILWFQADGNERHPEEYCELIQTLIKSWRAEWHESLPFYYVEENNIHAGQTEPAEKSGLAFVREAENAALELPGVDVATSVDLGVGTEAHFPNKWEVGKRLAGLALNNLYGQPGLVHSPQYAGMTVEGSSVRLQFKYADGLRSRQGGPIRGFALRSESGTWVWAEGRIENQEIVLTSHEVPHPAAIRYGWAGNPILSIENAAGLPLRPFRTDSDPIVPYPEPDWLPKPCEARSRPAVEALRPFVEKGDIAGAVLLVADRHHVLESAAIGYANLGRQKPMKPDDVFWIASMSKAITAAALMILVDEGKVHLDDAVEKYLPEFAGQMLIDPKNPSAAPRKPAHPIIIREILSHTSGLPFQSKKERMPLDRLPLKKAVESYAQTPLVFEPGTDFLYSNAGINTAGRIVEVVSGQPYESFLHDRVLAPLGMTETSFYPTEQQVSRIAASYEENAQQDNLIEIRINQLTYPLTDHLHRFPMPAGGLFSTAPDIARFCQMILNRGVGADGKQILSAGAVKEMTTRQTPPSVKTPYAFGFDVGMGHIVHNGAYKTSMRIDPALGLVAVFMVQSAGRLPGDDEKQIPSVFMATAEQTLRAHSPSADPAWSPEAKEQQRQAAAALLSRLNQAIASGARRFIIPPGDYRFEGPTGRDFVLQDLSHFELIAEGVTFWFDPHYGIRIRRCHNLTVKGLIVDCDPLPWLQGTITAIHPESQTLEFSMQPGYPRPSPANLALKGRILFFDPETRHEIFVQDESVLELGMGPGDGYTVKRFSKNLLFKPPTFPRSPRIGDSIVINNEKLGGGNIRLQDCAAVTLDSVSIYASANFAFHEEGGEGGDIYRNCRLIPRPGSTRLMASRGDGFHSTLMAHGPLIEGCELSHAGDDLLAIQGFFGLVLSSSSPREIILASPGGPICRPGSALAAYRLPDGLPVGDAQVTKIEPIRDPEPIALLRDMPATVAAKLKIRIRTMSGGTLTRVTFDRDLPLQALDVIGCDDFCGAGSVVRDNYIHDGHIRGILIKSRNTTVEDNRVERTGHSGIALEAELFWLEGPFNHDARIRRNHLSDNGWGGLLPEGLSVTLAAVTVGNYFGPRLFPRTLTLGEQNSGIAIEDNTIVHSAAFPIWARNTEGMTITGNRIDRPFAGGNPHGILDLSRLLQAGMTAGDSQQMAELRDPRYAVVLQNVSNAVVKGNETEHSPAGFHGELEQVQLGRPFNVRDFGAVGDGHANDEAAFQATVDRAIQSGPGSIVIIPAGRYQLTPVGPKPGANIAIRNAHGLTIRGEGTPILDCSNPDAHVFQLEAASDIHFAGLRIERHPFLFTQGSIVGLSVPDRTVDLQISAGYDEPDAKYLARMDFLFVFSDPGSKTWHRDAAWPPLILSRQRLRPGVWRLQLSRPPIPAFQGSTCVIWKNLYRGWAFAMAHSRDITVDDVAYYADGGQAAFVINHCEGLISFHRLKVDVQPGTDQRFASAGGAMVFNNRIELTVDDCDFNATDDDGINMGMNSSHVLAQLGPRQVRIEAGDDRADYRPGDHVALWDWTEKRERLTAVVVTAEKAGHDLLLTLDRDVVVKRTGGGPWKEFLATGPKGDQSEADREAKHAARRANETDGIDRIANLDDAGSAIIRNSRFSSYRARNILMKAPRSIIENNVFHDTTMASVLVGPEFYWDEGPAIKGLIIRNNHFDHIDGSNILIEAHRSDLSTDNRDITIEGNVFEHFGHPALGTAGEPGTAMLIRNASNVDVTHNLIREPDPAAPAVPRISIEVSENVRQSDNRIDP